MSEFLDYVWRDFTPTTNTLLLKNEGGGWVTLSDESNNPGQRVYIGGDGKMSPGGPGKGGGPVGGKAGTREQKQETGKESPQKPEAQPVAPAAKEPPKPATSPPTAPPSGQPGEYARTPEKHALKAAEVVKKKKHNEGANESHIITMADGSKAVFKPKKGEAEGLRGSISGNYYKREAAASDVADLLGMHDMVPPTVVKKVGNSFGSAQKFVDGAADAILFDKGERFDGKQDLARAAAYDHLIGNLDRHEGNWMLKGGKMVLIDNGTSFPDRTATMKEAPLRDRAEKGNLPIPKEFKDLKWEKLQTILEHYKMSKDEIKAAKGRLEDLQSSGNFKDLAGAHKARYVKEIS